jgi:hypothetical protein
MCFLFDVFKHLSPFLEKVDQKKSTGTQGKVVQKTNLISKSCDNTIPLRISFIIFEKNYWRVKPSWI